MQLKRQYTVGELTQEIVSSAPAWAFTDNESSTCGAILTGNDWLHNKELQHSSGIFYPCRIHEDGTIEQLGE